MNARAVIAFLLALVFQLAQTLPVAEAASAAPCAFKVERCDCCAAQPACPCASEQEDPAPDAPVLPAQTEILKVPAAKPEPARFAALHHAPVPPAVRPEIPDVTAPSGIAGVSHAVAFCSFLI